MHGGDGRIEEIFEARELRDSFLARRIEHLQRTSVRDDFSILQHHHRFAHGERLFQRMGDVDDRDAMRGVPRAQVRR